MASREATPVPPTTVVAVLFVIAVGAGLHWYVNFPPSHQMAERVVGVVTRHEPRLKPGNNLITQDDILTIQTSSGARQVIVGERPRPYGMVIVGREIVTLLDRHGWVMSLEVEGKGIIDYEDSARSARKRFVLQTVFGGLLLAIAGTMAAAGRVLRT